MEKTEYGVRSAEYGVLSAEYGVFKQTPSFPLYVGIKWKTRSLSLKCFFRFFPLYAPIKWKRRSLFKNHRQI